MSDWQPMDSFPKDGTLCDVLCKGEGEAKAIAYKIKWAREPIGGKYGYYGEQNRLSLYLTPIGWRLHDRQLEKERK